MVTNENLPHCVCFPFFKCGRYKGGALLKLPNKK